MGLMKCPRCELNYIHEDEQFCNICRRNMKGEKDEVEEMQNMCLECGENHALKGKELCAYCLGERKRREKLEALMDKPAELDVELTQLDEIDVPANSDIPSEDLREMHEEFGDDEEGNEEEDEESPDDEELDEELEEEYEILLGGDGLLDDLLDDDEDEDDEDE